MPMDCEAEHRAIIAVAMINKGHFVQDLYDALRICTHGVCMSPNNGDDKDDKWVVKAKLVITRADSETPAVNVQGEAKADMPASKSDGVSYLDHDGNIVAPDSALRQMPLWRGV